MSGKQPRDDKGKFVSKRFAVVEEQDEREELEKAKDYQKFRELREPVISKNHGYSGQLYRHYSHYQF
jgi:hypothetical protein